MVSEKSKAAVMEKFGSFLESDTCELVGNTVKSARIRDMRSGSFIEVTEGKPFTVCSEQAIELLAQGKQSPTGFIHRYWPASLDKPENLTMDAALKQKNESLEAQLAAMQEELARLKEESAKTAPIAPKKEPAKKK